MCLKTVLWAFDQQNLTGPERFVLIALANHKNSKTKLCCPKLDTIGTFTKLSRRTIQRCLRRLESLGYIGTSTRYEKNKQQSSLYTLHTMQGEGEGVSVTPPGCHGDAPRASGWRTEPVTEPVIKPEVPAQSANERRIEMDQKEVPIDEPPKAKLFREGKIILVALGVSESRSGAVIGRWFKSSPDAVGILAALEYAYKNNVIEPIAYVTKLLNTGGKTNGNRQEGFDDMVKRLADEARDLERKAGIGRASDSFRSH